MDENRKGKYALSPPSGPHDWWNINDTTVEDAVFTIRADFPDAEEIVRLAWSKIPAE